MQELHTLISFDPGKSGYTHRTYMRMRDLSPQEALGFMAELKQRVLATPIGSATLEQVLHNYFSIRPDIARFFFYEGRVYAANHGEEIRATKDMKETAKESGKLLFSLVPYQVVVETLSRSS